MRIPTHNDLMWPTVKAIRELGGSARNAEIEARVIANENYSDEVISAMHNARDYEEEDNEDEYEEEYDGHPKWLRPESCSECPETYMGSDPDTENGLCLRCNYKLGNFRDCRDCGNGYVVGNRSSTSENGLCANCQRKFRAQNRTDEE